MNPEKFEFGSYDWFAALRCVYENVVSDNRESLKGVEWSVCEVFTGVPKHLVQGRDGTIAWHYRLRNGKLRSVEELGKRLTKFTVRFFDFAFLDIDDAFLHTEHTGPVSHEDLAGALTAMEKLGMLDKSKNLQEIILAGKITVGNREFNLYVLPIWFGERWLGYMGLFSRKRISRFYQKFLMEFENNFLDDQLMHVIQQPR